MKDFRKWGIRIRKNPTYNYYSWWHNLKTIRLDVGETMELPPAYSEFYDVGVTSRCNAGCSFCYVNGSSSGEDAPNIIETWKKWIDSLTPDIAIDPVSYKDDDPIFAELMEYPAKDDPADVALMKLTTITAAKVNKPIVLTEKPFQIAIGSTGEPSIHPDLPEFLEAVYGTNIVPNYTTNGIVLSNADKAAKLLEYTNEYCGGVAISYGNKDIRQYADKAIENLHKHTNCKLMIHHLISNKASVDEMIDAVHKWGTTIHYHVLLPLMKHGRSQQGMDEDAFLYMADQLKEENITKIAFGANFCPYFKKYPNLINIWEYPQETYSKNIIMQENKIIITPSSYNLNPIQTIDL